MVRIHLAYITQCLLEVMWIPFLKPFVDLWLESKLPMAIPFKRKKSANLRNYVRRIRS